MPLREQWQRQGDAELQRTRCCDHPVGPESEPLPQLCAPTLRGGARSKMAKKSIRPDRLVDPREEPELGIFSSACRTRSLRSLTSAAAAPTVQRGIRTRLIST